MQNIVPLNSILQEPNFCVDKPWMWALDKKMKMHQILGPNYKLNSTIYVM